MGAEQSSPSAKQSSSIPVDLSVLQSFRKQPQAIQMFVQHNSDGYLAMGKCVDDVSAKWDARMTLYMHPDERKEFQELQVEKEQIIDAVAKFVGVEVVRYKRMKGQVKGGVRIADLFANNTAQQQIKHCEDLQLKLTQLKFKFQDFKERLQQAMSDDGRDKQKWFRQFGKWLAGLAGLAYGLGALALLVCHFIPGVNVCLMGVEVAACVIAAPVLVGAATATLLQQDEVDRAMQYLDKLETNLHTMKMALEQVRNENITIADDGQSVEDFRNLVGTLELRCAHILEICVKARAPA